MSIEGQAHSLTLFFPGFCIFCAYTRPRYQVSGYRTLGPLVVRSYLYCRQSLSYTIHANILLTEGMDSHIVWVNMYSQYHSFNMSLVMRKPTFCICENKGADQLGGNPEADQRLYFRYKDSTIPLLSKSEISSL